MEKDRLMAITLLLIAVLSFTVTVQRVEATAQVNILTHTGYLDSLGYYHVVGEVQNAGDVAVNFVKVRATFYDANNIVIATSFSYTMMDVLLSGRKAPFDIILSDTAQSVYVASYSLGVTFSATSPKPIGLQILSNSSYVDGIGWMHIVGEIKNIGTVTATFVKVVATYYNATGNVVAVAFTYSDPKDLAPNQKAPFDILLSAGRTPYVASYALEAESTQYAVVPEFSSAIILLLFIIFTLVAVTLKRVKKKANTPPVSVCPA